MISTQNQNQMRRKKCQMHSNLNAEMKNDKVEVMRCSKKKKEGTKKRK